MIKKKTITDGIEIYQKNPLTDRKKRIFISMIDNDEFKIPKKIYAGPNNNVNLDWMNDKIGYEEQPKKRIQFI